MQCPRCHAENREGRRFCGECGLSFASTCPSCGFLNEGSEKFCGGCGRSLTLPPTLAEPKFGSPQSYTPKHLAEKILTSKSALEGERKQVTVLFCDLVNSTALAERLGPEGMHRLLSRFFEIALIDIHRYEGTINQFLGDGFMALFGAPLTHEDHARRAVLAALAIQRNLISHNADLGLEPEQAVAVRMGLNTGRVVVGKIGDNLRMDYTAIGDTTHVAARLQQHAEPGDILVSAATEGQVRNYVLLEPLGMRPVKGKREPVRAYKILGLAPRRSSLDTQRDRPSSQFVGRDREMAILHDLLEQVEAGHGQIVGIVGEPGVGKSRLLYEFHRSSKSGGVTYLEGQCLSYGSTIPYLPVVDIIRSNCGIAESDTPDVIAEKVRFSLEEVAMVAEEAAPYLLHLLGVKEATDRLEALTPDVIKARTLEILRQLAMKGGQRRPIIFAIEDLHWWTDPRKNISLP